MHQHHPGSRIKRGILQARSVGFMALRNGKRVLVTPGVFHHQANTEVCEQNPSGETLALGPIRQLEEDITADSAVD